MIDRLPSVLLYHQIDPDPVERTSVTPERFWEQIGALRNDGWRFVPLLQLAELVASGAYGPGEESCLALTFDDGYADFLQIAPQLVDERIPATVFLITEAVGGMNWWNPKAHRLVRHLGLDEIARLGRDGVDFQLHGVDHQRLTKLEPASLEIRFAAGQRWFEKNLSTTAAGIAYPYGGVNDFVLQEAQRWFKYGVSVHAGHWGGPRARFELNRVEVTGTMTADLLVRLLSCDRRKRGELLAAARLNLPAP